jgi:hypothetical protein
MFDTWMRGSQFDYEGNVENGTTIIYGQNESRIQVTALNYEALLNNFQGRVIQVSSSRTELVAGSLEAWLQENVSRTTISTYVAAILVNEGFATRTANNEIQFNI